MPIIKRGSLGKLLGTIGIIVTQSCQMPADALQGMKGLGLSSGRPGFKAEIESILGEE